ncbi:MAG: hypothetical protein ABJD97_00385 [Betaproteobacteria bacterium]
MRSPPSSRPRDDGRARRVLNKHQVSMQEPRQTGIASAINRPRHGSEEARDDQADNAAPATAAMPLSRGRSTLH